jgi:hypothetical protein
MASGVSVVIDELSQSACPLRGMVNLTIAVPQALLMIQLKGLTLQAGAIEELWGYSAYFTVQQFPPPGDPPPVVAGNPLPSTVTNNSLPPPCFAGTTVTIVTASIVIEPNRHDFTRGLRSILQLGCPTVVYGDAAAAAAVASHLEAHPLHRVSVINITIRELQSWRHYDTLDRRATPNFRRLINWTTQHALYLSIVLLKPVWLLDVVTGNIFETEHVLWLDASPRCLGLLHTPLRLDHPQFEGAPGEVHCTKRVPTRHTLRAQAW